MILLAKRLLAGAWGYIAAGLAVLVTVLVALSRAKKAGKDEVMAQSAKKEVANAKSANKIEDAIAAARPDDVRDRLRKYTRD
jgi:hypothetical protein